jgi:hypothetical protein
LAFLFAAALVMWLLLRGPVTKMPPFVQKASGIAMVFFAYCGFLYLLKWNRFWEWMLSLGFENRNTAEGFLILISTLFWVIATMRILLRRFRIPDARSDALESPIQRPETTRRGLTLTDLILWYHSFHRK